MGVGGGILPSVEGSFGTLHHPEGLFATVIEAAPLILGLKGLGLKGK